MLSVLPGAPTAGADVARYAVAWNRVQPRQDELRWHYYDRVYEQMIRVGLRPILTLGNAPLWAQDCLPPEPINSCYYVSAPSARWVGTFAQFAVQVAHRYPQAAAIEVWNEPNWAAYWGADPDPALYAQMVRETANAIHASGSSIPVLVAGGAPFGETAKDGSHWGYADFLEGVYMHGGVGEADGVAHHVYFGRDSDVLLRFRQQVARVKAVMRANGDSDLPVWITEIGVSSAEQFDTTGQAFALAYLYSVARRIAGLSAFIVHRYMDAYDPAANAIEARGVVDADGALKPAFCTLAGAREMPVPAGC